jgi:CelD/BcsL family acetyltransferase involved in cellulose biosynthesis
VALSEAVRALPAEEHVAGPAKPASLLALDDPRWQAFVHSHPKALIFHRPEWARAVSSSYKWQAFVLAQIGNDGSIDAGIPVIGLRDLRRRERWVSLPFSDLCPPLLSDRTSASGFARALEQARLDAGVVSFEVRGALAGFSHRQHREAVLHTTALTHDADELFARCHPSQVRRNIRRAEREQLHVRELADRSDFVEVFNRLHAQTRRRQGMPVQPHRFFVSLWEHLFADEMRESPARLVLVDAPGRPAIAGALLLAGTRTLTYKYGASDPACWRLRPNHLLFAYALRSACEAGFEWFDWGRSDLEDRGLRDFKSGWAASEADLVHTTLGAQETPTAAGDEQGAAMQTARALLRHSPVFACRAAGELFYRFAA